MWITFFAIRNLPSIKRRLRLRELDWSMIKLFFRQSMIMVGCLLMRRVCACRPRVYEIKWNVFRNPQMTDQTFVEALRNTHLNFSSAAHRFGLWVSTWRIQLMKLDRINQILLSNPIVYVVSCGNSLQKLQRWQKAEATMRQKDNTFCFLSICARHNFYTKQLITFADGPSLMNKGTVQIGHFCHHIVCRVVGANCRAPHWTF